ncbi:MAG: hypothetical protein ABIH21_04110 [Patescibacteria group bacterium]
MTTLSIPIPQNLEAFIQDMITKGVAPNKAEVVRQALVRYAEDQAVEAVMQSMREYKEGKILRGDIDELAEQMP